MGDKDRAPLAKVENKMEHIDISGYLPRYFLHFNNIVHGYWFLLKLQHKAEAKMHKIIC